MASKRSEAPSTKECLVSKVQCINCAKIGSKDDHFPGTQHCEAHDRAKIKQPSSIDYRPKFADRGEQDILLFDLNTNENGTASCDSQVPK